jgi:Protein of unknown function (DUF3800)
VNSESLVSRSRCTYNAHRTLPLRQGLQFRGPRESAGFRVSGRRRSFYIAYMDEFGHVGPYISRRDARHNTSPVFGLNALFMMVLDEHRDETLRASIVAEASREMFGNARRNNMIEPPIQAESHLFQTIQCADWICGLMGRIACYDVAPRDYLDLEWTMRYFKQRLTDVAPISSIRREGPNVQPAWRGRADH